LVLFLRLSQHFQIIVQWNSSLEEMHFPLNFESSEIFLLTIVQYCFKWL